ncbi:MAG: arsenate reductase/protein-tyrosine-phosphatase family protein [Candidatus Hodarchaeales archaeon]
MSDIDTRRQKIIQQFNKTDKFKILFICSGNIIRSPYAHLLFNHMINQDEELGQRLLADSGGVKYRNSSLSYETYQELLKEGLSEDELTKFVPKYLPDFPRLYEESGLILVMEKSHLRTIPHKYQSKSFLLLEFTDGITADVPDPYFDPPFDRSYKMIKSSLKRLQEFFRDVLD